ncbi:uncharacterized protein PSANT_01626 [Moesziomyces antarcticus]|uniref:Uncharacterized protein n=1 Tax=Pseudozyma antarctica TaxID=84753 RepID=A0A5C3FK82_PSEA2|nr:uncharacterized protein PSANT_01626 [Moesziomyces antarcticus]
MAAAMVIVTTITTITNTVLPMVLLPMVLLPMVLLLMVLRVDLQVDLPVMDLSTRLRLLLTARRRTRIPLPRLLRPESRDTDPVAIDPGTPSHLRLLPITLLLLLRLLPEGRVGPPGRPRGPHRDLTESKGNGEKPKEPKEPKKALGDVVYTVEVPSKEEWEDAGISALELKICTTRRPDATGLDIFNASGIPPSHAHINPAFERIAPLFNTTVQLPSHYARAPIRAGFFP